MRTATFILSFAIVGLASCSAPRTLIQSSRTDSVGIDRKVDIRTRIEYVPIIVHIPDQRASAIIEPSDTSHLKRITPFLTLLSVPMVSYTTTYGTSRRRSR